MSVSVSVSVSVRVRVQLGLHLGLRRGGTRQHVRRDVDALGSLKALPMAARVLDEARLLG